MGVEGLRRVEVMRLNDEDIDYERKRILIRGKGHNGFIYPCDATMDKLLDYLYKRGPVEPENNYTPAQPLTVAVTVGPYAWQEEGYAKLELRSSGADSTRQVVLRKAKNGKWYLWEQYLLPDIRPPESQNPWA